MMMPFFKTDDMNTVKNNISSFVNHFAEDDNTWLQKAFGRNIFSDSKFPMPQVSLDMNDDIPGKTVAYAECHVTSLVDRTVDL